MGPLSCCYSYAGGEAAGAVLPPVVEADDAVEGEGEGPLMADTFMAHVKRW